jgi:hypothetical protein
MEIVRDCGLGELLATFVTLKTDMRVGMLTVWAFRETEMGGMEEV